MYILKDERQTERNKKMLYSLCKCLTHKTHTVLQKTFIFTSNRQTKGTLAARR